MKKQKYKLAKQNKNSFLKTKLLLIGGTVFERREYLVFMQKTALTLGHIGWKVDKWCLTESFTHSAAKSVV